MAEAVLSAAGLRKSFGALVATNDLSLDLNHGEIHALIGPNGAGKTTALAQLSGQIRPDAGKISYRGRDITRAGMPARARDGIVRSFQITAICNGFSALENVAVAVQSKSRHHFRFWRPASCDQELDAEAAALLERTDLLAQAETLASNLSHGQKRQLELAMALATDPTVLLLDEPMAGMGPAETEQMTGLIAEIRHQHAILLVEHDMDVVFSLADRVSVLVNGRILASGRPDDVRSDAKVRRAYLDDEEV